MVRDISGGSAALVLAISTTVLGASPAFCDDPPTRVGRIAYLEGTVSFHPSPDDPWGVAVLNYPVAASTALWVDEGGRAELEIGAALIRLDSGTELDVTELDDQTIHLSLPQGRIDVTLHGSRTDEHYEIETPRGEVTLADGAYRIDSGAQDQATRIAAFAGAAEIDLNNLQTAVGPGLEASAGPTEPPIYALAPTTADAFDDWAAQRDGRTRPPPASAQAVPGTASLAEYGSWRTVPDYGAVWTPADVPVGWTPYSVGHWGWVAPWGWTWVDAEPWGFAPFHYGRWIELGGAWSWVPVEPGVAVEPGFVPVYAPAVVSFVGDPLDLVVGFGGPVVGWIPLGPGEFWQPWFPVGVEYVRRANVINVHRGVINGVTISNYRTAGAGQALANQGAARVVPQAAFAGGRPVQSAALPVSAAALARPLHAGTPGAGAAALPAPTRTARLAAVPARAGAASPAAAPTRAQASPAAARAAGPAAVVRGPASAYRQAAPSHPGAPMPQRGGTPPQAMPQGRSYGPPAGYPQRSPPAQAAPRQNQGGRAPAGREPSNR
jgi:hypothetical protein